MAIILSLETSTDICSVALHKDGSLLKELQINQPQAHAAQLAPLVDQLLKTLNINPKTLDAVAVSSGPGSYTGLRIGTSTGKGLCYALDIPLIAVPTLLIMAYTAKKSAPAEALLCPMIDARRMEVYCQVLDNELNEIVPLQATVVENNSFTELLNQHTVLFFGNGAAKCKEIIIHRNAAFVDDVVPSAAMLGELASRKFEKGYFENLSDFNPLYLKEFLVKPAKRLI